MSKERLEEIVAVVESQKESVRKLSHNDLNWLIEQAERVEVLERENKALNNILTTLEKQDKIKLLDQNVRLIKQNKRYREALESVLNNDQMYITNEEIILKALEESE